MNFRVFERGTTELVVIRLSNGEEIKTTPEHPFWVEGKGWTVAGDLKSVDRLTTTSSTSTIASITWKRTTAKVYNFEVKDYHTYFVSANGAEVWVHNACKPPKGPSRPGAMNRDPSRPDGVRVDNGHTSVPGSQPHVHYGEGPTWNLDGTVGHKGSPGMDPADWPKAVKDWIEGHGWRRPEHPKAK